MHSVIYVIASGLNYYISRLHSFDGAILSERQILYYIFVCYTER
jgi:hypothetical protein